MQLYPDKNVYCSWNKKHSRQVIFLRGWIIGASARP